MSEYKYKYICGSGGCCAEVDVVGITGTTETYPAAACGKCGVPICVDCHADSVWTFDGHRCCRPCNDKLVKEAGS